MITDKEIQAYWNWYDWFIIRWNMVSFFFILSVISFFASIVLFILEYNWWIWLYIYGLIVPFNIFLKYGLGVKGLWFFNDTVDGDFGSKAELEKAGRKEGKTLGNFLWWWGRNHSWNFNRKFIPEWNEGEVDEIRIIHRELPEGSHDFTWCEKNGIHGINYIAYRINGKVEVRYSKADSNFQKQLGSGGNEYRFRIKGIFQSLYK